MASTFRSALLAKSVCLSATSRTAVAGALVRHRTLGQVRGLASSAVRAAEDSVAGPSGAGSGSGSGSSTNGQTKARTGRTLLAGSAIAATFYLAGTFFPPDVVTLLFPRPAPTPLAPGSPAGLRHVQQLEREIVSLEYLETLRKQADANEWYESRPFFDVDPNSSAMQNHLTVGALRAPARLAIPPLVRARKDESSAYVFVHVGRGLCGHDGIVHGGLLATLVDEASARTALLNLPTHVGVTARLEMNYKNPVRADRFIVIKSTLVERKGRKAVVESTVEDLDGTVYVQSRAVFVEPKYAKLLSNGEILKALGVPPPDADTGAK